MAGMAGQVPVETSHRIRGGYGGGCQALRWVDDMQKGGGSGEQATMSGLSRSKYGDEGTGS